MIQENSELLSGDIREIFEEEGRKRNEKRISLFSVVVVFVRPECAVINEIKDI